MKTKNCKRGAERMRESSGCRGSFLKRIVLAMIHMNKMEYYYVFNGES